MGERCTLAADVYSFGVLLTELTTQRLVRKRDEWRLPRAPEECPPAVLALIQRCIAIEPQQRPSAAEALQWLQDAGSSGRVTP
jgi:serine/threonine protein kinase